MRCECCNKNLNDWEATLKDSDGRYLTTCNGCLKGLAIPTIGRSDLERFELPPSDWLDVGEPFLDDLFTDDDFLEDE